MREQENVGFLTIARTVFGAYPRRTIVGLSLFTGQAFLYNAVFFTYALVLTTFYDVPSGSVPLYIIPFAVGNFLGPLVLGRLFDTVGRKPMIAGSYIVFFYAVGTAAGGITGPLLFGRLVESEEVGQVFWGYLLGAALMVAAGLVQAFIGIEAAQKSLEDVAKPLSAEAAEGAEGEERRPAAPPRRRARFGPSESGTSWSPIVQSSSRAVPDEDTDEEVAALVSALREAGPDGLERRVLGTRVNCRQWGPGRYRRALGIALSRGDIRRTGRSRFVAGG